MGEYANLCELTGRLLDLVAGAPGRDRKSKTGRPVWDMASAWRQKRTDLMTIPFRLVRTADQLGSLRAKTDVPAKMRQKSRGTNKNEN